MQKHFRLKIKLRNLSFGRESGESFYIWEVRKRIELVIAVKLFLIGELDDDDDVAKVARIDPYRTYE